MRKRWDNLPAKTLITLKKLEGLFNRNPSIKVDEFFSAPFIVYHDWRDQHEQYTNFPLEFYLKYKAIALYKMVREERVMSYGE